MAILRTYPILWLLLCILWTCGPAQEETEPAAENASEVIERAVQAHGMEGFATTDITFTFREREYGIRRDGGKFAYTRDFTDSTGNHVVDLLDNTGLQRRVNDSMVVLTAKDSAAYAESVNSVRYFFMLPYGLDDPAAHAELLDTITIKEQLYDQVAVTFAPEGGGADFEDVYRYFFNRSTGELDYLAYTFEVNDGGLRFREATNKRRINGVLVQDYINYGVNGEDRDIASVGRRYAEGALPRLSVIENTDVNIR
ncbi:hypothetical protein GGR28_000787 [Lewinella aquimaris]|uniref:Deoxyribose-phosphate aldolase n=1 Tax=Neolewinella aquimaris TaxID=1835722 RepID=A0A840EB17_9BACT|nr:DUF6503 family protein [Neolewinella aquimaris]MBB4078186.1 hypothetical protein [Neolewinella aquimaris]